MRSQVSKQKFYCTELDKQRKLSLKLLKEGREAKFNSTETESRIFKYWGEQVKNMEVIIHKVKVLEEVNQWEIVGTLNYIEFANIFLCN